MSAQVTAFGPNPFGREAADDRCDAATLDGLKRALIYADEVELAPGPGRNHGIDVFAGAWSSAVDLTRHGCSLGHVADHPR